MTHPEPQTRQRPAGTGRRVEQDQHTRRDRIALDTGRLDGFTAMRPDGHALSPRTAARIASMLPMIAIEARIALDVARDLHHTGGCSVEDGKRLRTACDRLRRFAEVIAEAEREVAA